MSHINPQRHSLILFQHNRKHSASGESFQMQRGCEGFTNAVRDWVMQYWDHNNHVHVTTDARMLRTADARMALMRHEDRTPVHYVVSAAPHFIAANDSSLFPNKTVPDWVFEVMEPLLKRIVKTTMLGPKVVSDGHRFRKLIVGPWGAGAFNGNSMRIFQILKEVIVEADVLKYYDEVHICAPLEKKDVPTSNSHILRKFMNEWIMEEEDKPIATRIVIERAEHDYLDMILMPSGAHYLCDLSR